MGGGLVATPLCYLICKNYTLKFSFDFCILDQILLRIFSGL